MNTDNLIRLKTWADAHNFGYSYAYKLYSEGKLEGIVIDKIIFVNQDAILIKKTRLSNAPKKVKPVKPSKIL